MAGVGHLSDRVLTLPLPRYEVLRPRPASQPLSLYQTPHHATSLALCRVGLLWHRETEVKVRIGMKSSGVCPCLCKYLQK